MGLIGQREEAGIEREDGEKQRERIARKSEKMKE